MKADLNVMMARIEAIANAEKVTKVELGTLSREILQYIVLDDTNDIGLVNRLFTVLTPVNRKVAGLFFVTFLPFAMNQDVGLFGNKMKGDKKLARFKEQAEQFLANEANNIWTWAEQNVKVEKKPVDYLAKITKDIAKALNDEEAELSQADIIKAVLAGGVQVEAIAAMLGAMAEQE